MTAPVTPRHDGWTPERQRAFVEHIAGGDTVEVACRRVGLAPSSAYALRRRAAGAAFALAWDGARLLARETLADTLLTRALDGQEETITRADGSVVVRRRVDNRLATTMLRRLDAYADANASAAGAAARLVAGEFDAFLDLLATAGGPARAGLFLGARLADTGLGEAAAADLAPVFALARADRWLRTHASDADVPVADLDPAARGDWSVEQWRRAEAAGLMALAPPAAPRAPEPRAPEPRAPESAPASPLPPLHKPFIDAGDQPEPVWWCDAMDEWRTRFPPSVHFFGEEEGEYGDEHYSRQLDDDESEALRADRRRAVAGQEAAEAAERDRWFGFATDAARAAPIARDDDDDDPDDDYDYDRDDDDVDAEDRDAIAGDRDGDGVGDSDRDGDTDADAPCAEDAAKEGDGQRDGDAEPPV